MKIRAEFASVPLAVAISGPEPTVPEWKNNSSRGACNASFSPFWGIKKEKKGITSEGVPSPSTVARMK
jgi:hypothetical protein